MTVAIMTDHPVLASIIITVNYILFQAAITIKNSKSPSPSGHDYKPIGNWF